MKITILKPSKGEGDYQLDEARGGGGPYPKR